MARESDVVLRCAVMVIAVVDFGAGVTTRIRQEW